MKKSMFSLGLGLALVFQLVTSVHANRPVLRETEVIAPEVVPAPVRPLAALRRSPVNPYRGSPVRPLAALRPGVGARVPEPVAYPPLPQLQPYRGVGARVPAPAWGAPQRCAMQGAVPRGGRAPQRCAMQGAVPPARRVVSPMYVPSVRPSAAPRPEEVPVPPARRVVSPMDLPPVRPINAWSDWSDEGAARVPAPAWGAPQPPYFLSISGEALSVDPLDVPSVRPTPVSRRPLPVCCSYSFEKSNRDNTEEIFSQNEEIFSQNEEIFSQNEEIFSQNEEIFNQNKDNTKEISNQI